MGLRTPSLITEGPWAQCTLSAGNSMGRRQTKVISSHPGTSARLWPLQAPELSLPVPAPRGQHSLQAACCKAAFCVRPAAGSGPCGGQRADAPTGSVSQVLAASPAGGSEERGGRAEERRQDCPFCLLQSALNSPCPPLCQETGVSQPVRDPALPLSHLLPLSWQRRGAWSLQVPFQHCPLCSGWLLRFSSPHSQCPGHPNCVFPGLDHD